VVASRDVRLEELKLALSKHVVGFDVELSRCPTLPDALRFAAEKLMGHVTVAMSGGHLDRFTGKDVLLRDKLRGTAADNVSFLLPGETVAARRKESIVVRERESTSVMEQEVYVLGDPSEEEDEGEEVVSSHPSSHAHSA